MHFDPENPLIVQSDNTLMLETMGERFAAARDALAPFAELVKSPEYLHTYRITPLSLWNAAAAGVTVADVLGALTKWSKYPVPPNVPQGIQETMARYGRLVLRTEDDGLVLEADEGALMAEVRGLRSVRPFLGRHLDAHRTAVAASARGELKQALIAHGLPVQDRAGFRDGDRIDVALTSSLIHGGAWELRTYQSHAVDAFLAGPTGTGEGGSGVVVLPCGAGKTIVGLTALARLGMKTLILCTNITALRQWRAEILEKTTLTADQVGEYSGETKEVCPVTLTTYQMLTWRRSREDAFVHFGLFDKEDWGLVIYDEVHLLPAPIFRTVAHIQARRRLGLTATLVREDGHEGDVFALIGPKRFDMPWKDLEHQGWIASARCTEVRVPLPADLRLPYATAAEREKFRMAATNPAKAAVAEMLMGRHPEGRILVIGMYLSQLQELADRWGTPLITGRTRQSERDAIFQAFRTGEVRVLVISRVGNFSVDLPDADVLVQVSGTWGSRQEEAQRLGRILRPKRNGNQAWFYTLLSRDTVEQDFGEKRQLFLAEQGYGYEIEVAE
ncbi:MAG: DNA repair helicase XPB [Myxococcota bacterium]|nr:DNA repair helicase XPB [Myxococcota bacterium]